MTRGPRPTRRGPGAADGSWRSPRPACRSRTAACSSAKASTRWSRSLRGEPFRLSDHVERMRNGGPRRSASRRACPGFRSGGQSIAELHRREPHPSAILYAQVTGGTAPRSHVPQQTPRPVLLRLPARFAFPKARRDGPRHRRRHLPDPRWQRRDLKTVMLLPAVLARKEALARGAEEAIFVGQDGFVNEGAVSTVFAVHGRGGGHSAGDQRNPRAGSARKGRRGDLPRVRRWRSRSAPAVDRPAESRRDLHRVHDRPPHARRSPGRRTRWAAGAPGTRHALLAQRFQRTFWGPEGPRSEGRVHLEWAVLGPDPAVHADVAPVMYDAASESRKPTTRATSCGLPRPAQRHARDRPSAVVHR